MPKSKFSLTHKDENLIALAEKCDHKILARWTIDCVERVLPYFTEKYPQDHRPQKALETLQNWINTGDFKMAVIRKAALDSHAAARSIGKEDPARSVAHAAGQAVATAHVASHAIAVANYALQVIYLSDKTQDEDDALEKERGWQYRHLLELQKNGGVGKG